MDIVVTTTASAPVVQRGQDLTFTVTATNNGPASATGLVVADRLPPGYTTVAVTGDGTYDPASSLWTVGDIAAGSSATLVITATAAAAGSWVNAAVLSRVDQWDTEPTNNSAEAPAEVDEQADLEIRTNVMSDLVEPGDVGTTVTVTNLGPNESSTVEVGVLELPGADIVESSSATLSYQSRRVWTVGALAPGQSATLALRQRVTRPGITINTVQIIQSGTPDPDLVNNIARTVVGAPSADVVVLAGADVARVGVGGEVLFTVVATNIGPHPAEGVSVIDMLAPQLSLVELTTTVGGYDAASGVWRVGELLPGEIETLSIKAIAGWPGEVHNRAVITSESPIDSDQDNNSAEIALTIAARPEPAGSGSRAGWAAALAVSSAGGSPVRARSGCSSSWPAPPWSWSGGGTR